MHFLLDKNILEIFLQYDKFKNDLPDSTGRLFCLTKISIKIANAVVIKIPAMIHNMIASFRTLSPVRILNTNTISLKNRLFFLSIQHT